MGILERARVLDSERCAKDYYKRLRWGGSRKCPECGGDRLFPLSDRRYECRRCGFRFSDFAGTYRSGIKLGFHRVAWLVQLFSLELSAHRSARELSMDYRMVYRFFDRIRRAIARDNCESWLSGEVEL
jgi:transposase-like protein